ncbi:hypothetical protein [Catellatospora sp. NPDC049133]
MTEMPQQAPEAIFDGPVALATDATLDAYGRKPNGSDDQGYKDES